MLAVSMNGTAGPWTYAEETKAPAETSADASAVNDAENNTADTTDSSASDTNSISSDTDIIDSENAAESSNTAISEAPADEPSDASVGGTTSSENNSLNDNTAETNSSADASDVDFSDQEVNTATDNTDDENTVDSGNAVSSNEEDEIDKQAKVEQPSFSSLSIMSANAVKPQVERGTNRTFL